MRNLTDKQWGYLTLRTTLGINMLMHGLTRIVAGVGAFADNVAREFEAGMLPVGIARAFLIILPYIELVIGALMVVGFQFRYALIAGGFTITALTFGSTANQNWGAAGIQLSYAIAFFILLFTIEHNRLAIDRASDHNRDVA